MNPSTNEGINLPAPITEQAPTAPGAVEANTPRAEQAAARAEQAPATPQAMPPLAAPLQPVQPIMPQPSVVSATTTNVVQNIKDDGDLIEKEWVLKAKQIVEATRDDPFKQSEELTVFKADYLNKRYNKSIKVS